MYYIVAKDSADFVVINLGSNWCNLINSEIVYKKKIIYIASAGCLTDLKLVRKSFSPFFFIFPKTVQTLLY